MAGKPFKVGKFAHTLRIRLMREHLGIDVDALDQDPIETDDTEKHPEKVWDPESEQVFGEDGLTHIKSKRTIPFAPVANLVLDGTRQGGAFHLHDMDDLMLTASSTLRNGRGDRSYRFQDFA